MELDLTGRRAFVGGASRGLGLAIAEALIAEGASVAIVARDPAALEAAQARLGARAIAIAADLGRTEQAADAVEQAAACWAG
jgi:3-oxoacyl-[acyl-carrier protein] reductase